MDDFSDLAARVGTSVGELRGVLILSRDGLVLGSFPEDDDSMKPAWLKFASMGDPDKAFVEFGSEMWAYVRRGPYAAFAIAGVGVRPGLLLEQLEQAILVAEEARSKREGLRLPDAPVEAPKGKPRTTLHPEPQTKEPLEEPVVVHAQAATPDAVVAAEAAATSTADATSVADAPEVAVQPEADAPAEPEAQPASRRSSVFGPAPTGEDDSGGGDGEVDRVMLAQEFSRLLQESGSHDEETP
ncbi:MAG: hypothetical protein ACJ758_08010 [Actinomycetota bacterium]